MKDQGRCDVDFARLSLKDTLDLAILMEEEARERYEELAEQLELHRSIEPARFFRKFAKLETTHEKRLQERRQQLFADQPQAIDRSMLWDLEAPAYEDARVFMSACQAAEVAMAAEIRAADFYGQAMPEISDAEVRKLFEELRDEEIEHQMLIREHMAELPEERQLDPDDYADPPRPM
jgi:rubrerythrin